MKPDSSRNNKKIIITIICLAITFVMAFMSYTVGKRLYQYRDQLKTLQHDLEDVNANIGLNEENIKNIQSEITEIETKIEQDKIEISTIENEIDALK